MQMVDLFCRSMQNDLKGPMAGTVRRVHVQDGTNVEATTVLLEVEPAP